MSLGRRAVQCRHVTVATNSSGRKVETIGSEFTISASVQSPTRNDLEYLPEGRRESLAAVLFTTNLLYFQGTDNRNPDQVFVEGRWCEVVAEQGRQSGIVPHNKYFVVHMNAVQ